MDIWLLKKYLVMISTMVSIIQIFIRNFFLVKYSLFEYLNNKFLLNKPYKNVNFQTIFQKHYKTFLQKIFTKQD
jgi:hypothetical protein